MRSFYILLKWIYLDTIDHLKFSNWKIFKKFKNLPNSCLIIYFWSNFTHTIRNWYFGRFKTALMRACFDTLAVRNRNSAKWPCFSWSDRFFRAAGRFCLISFLGKPFLPLKSRATLWVIRPLEWKTTRAEII